LAIGYRLLAQVIVDDQGVLAVEHEVFCHRRTGVRSDVLQRSRSTGTGNDDGGVIHRAVFAKRFDDQGDRRVLLADGHVEALNARSLLVDDRIKGHSGLAGLAVTDDQFALAAADGVIASMALIPVCSGS
jgi:hypothetical protein